MENLIKNPTLSDLIGGIQSVTLGDEEAGRRHTQKSILERKAPPTFELAVEMRSRQCWVVYENVADTVDGLLLGHQPLRQVRALDDRGRVTMKRVPPSSGIKRNTGKLLPFPYREERSLSEVSTHSEHGDVVSPQQAINSKEVPLPVYPYGLSRQMLAEEIASQDLPVVLTRNLETARVILTQSEHAKKDSNLEHLARCHHLPIQIVEAITVPSITRTLRRLLGRDRKNFYNKDSRSDRMAALEEARLAVERVVIPLRQPVDLLPRSAQVRKMQHQLVDRYRLHSKSIGSEPERCLRIYPA